MYVALTNKGGLLTGFAMRSDAEGFLNSTPPRGPIFSVALTNLPRLPTEVAVGERQLIDTRVASTHNCVRE